MKKIISLILVFVMVFSLAACGETAQDEQEPPKSEYEQAYDKALTAIYAEEKKNTSYLKHLRMGDFVCGAVAMQMCMGDTLMGGKCDFTGKRLVLTVAGFHKSLRNPDHTFRLDLISDKGVVESHEFSSESPFSIALDAEDVAFYRAEIYDVNRNLRIALGNPIWNG